MAGEAMTVAGMGLKVGSAQLKANSEAKAAQFNQYINTEKANEAISQATEQERQLRVSAMQQIGNERASYGASGVSSSSGSAMEVLQQSVANAELDALNIKHAGQVKAWGYQTGAALDEVNAANAHIAGNYAVANAILSSFNVSGGGGQGASSGGSAGGSYMDAGGIA